MQFSMSGDEWRQNLLHRKVFMLSVIGVFYRRMKIGFGKVDRFLLGSSDKFALRHRILNGTLLAGVFAMGMGLASEFFRVGFETGGLIALWVAFAFSIVFYYLARFRRKFGLLIAPTFLISAISTLMQIQYSGGIVSANLMVLFPLLVMFMIILGRRYDWLVILFFLSLLFLVQYVQSVQPGWFSDYSSAQARKEDFLVTGVTVLIVLGLMILTLNRSYEGALAEVRRLKDQQDGDYFLTSLLIRPLAGIRNKSETVQINTYIKQKKSFHFKEKVHELGGDICVADRILLRGRSYCVFANGDAMGKSMQGAGGALVFGAAFRALIERTHREAYLAAYFPEQWLREALNDMNSAFHGFDGSMSMSLILGLVDESIGYLYYINAEHPFPILLRSGQARFLSEAATNFKVGVFHERARIETFRIETFRILPGDKILIGSDGRDDLSIGSDDAEGRTINEDHTAILKEVERSKGDLQLLSDNLQNVGELTDDLSLLSIEFVPHDVATSGGASIDLAKARSLMEANDREGALEMLYRLSEQHPTEIEIWELLFKAHSSHNQPAEAAACAARYADLNPGSLQMMYNSAVQYARAGMLESALVMAERVQSRKPGSLPVLKLLIKLYEKTGQEELAREYRKELSSDAA